ncbi:hypothetical protein VF13_41115 [Nostoc linckia z16]|nr:hypothetical protein VF13_41115 [Nostoc linckia z16]
MTLMDIILGGLLAYGVVKGFQRGLFKELAGTLSLLFAVFLAVKLATLVGTFTGHGALAAFFITFFTVLIGVSLLAKVLNRITDAAGLGIIVRLLGAFFGCIKMALMLSVALHFFVKINFSNTLAKEETLQKSVFFYPLIKVSDTIFPVMKDLFNRDVF